MELSYTDSDTSTTSSDGAGEHPLDDYLRNVHAGGLPNPQFDLDLVSTSDEDVVRGGGGEVVGDAKGDAMGDAKGGQG
jgi:hypothetical protein